MQIGSGETWTQVSTTFFQTFFATPFSSPGGRCELGNWMRQVALPRRLLPRLQAEGLDRQDHQGLLRSVQILVNGSNNITDQPLWSGVSREAGR